MTSPDWPLLQPESERPRESSSRKQPTPVATSATTSVEDEDALLYGDASVGGQGDSVAGGNGEGGSGGVGDDGAGSVLIPIWRRHLRRGANSTYWAALLRKNGTLEILSLPDFAAKFAVNNLQLGKIIPST